MVFEGEKKYIYLLALLFLLVFASRLYFTFQNPGFTADSYYDLRHIEHIKQTGLPLFEDPLSYEGRTYYYPPFFHYLLAFTSMIMPLSLAAKILPSLLFSLLIPLVYAISYKITDHHGYSFLASLFFAFTPISYVFPINTVSAYSLAIPLFFGVVYTMLDMENLNLMLFLIVLLVFTHPSAFILVIGLLIYLILVKIEGLEVTERSTEIIIFTMFLVFWTLFILYKNVFLEQGMGAIWQNLPETLLAAAFPTLSIFQVIYFVGMVPLFFGLMGAYNAVFKETNKKLLLLLGLTLAIALLLAFSFVRLRTGLLYLSVLLSILTAHGLKARADYMKKTRFGNLRKWAITGLLFFFILTSVVPLYGSAAEQAQRTPPQAEIKAMEWLKNNSQEGSVVIAPVSDGHLITYYAKRKNVMDNNFLMIDDVNERFRDVRRLFTVRLRVEALRVLTKYDVDYILFTPTARQNHDVKKLYYTEDNCFEEVYDQNTTIYKVKCELRGATP